MEFHRLFLSASHDALSDIATTRWRERPRQHVSLPATWNQATPAYILTLTMRQDGLYSMFIGTLISAILFDMQTSSPTVTSREVDIFIPFTSLITQLRYSSATLLQRETIFFSESSDTSLPGLPEFHSLITTATSVVALPYISCAKHSPQVNDPVPSTNISSYYLTSSSLSPRLSICYGTYSS